jgi:hypothetical protein
MDFEVKKEDTFTLEIYGNFNNTYFTAPKTGIVHICGKQYEVEIGKQYIIKDSELVLHEAI